MKKELNYQIIVELNATSAWLSLSRSERRQVGQDELIPILNMFEHFEFCWIDCEAFSATVSDILQVRCNDLMKYYFFIEMLKDSKLISESYYVIKDFKIGVINGFEKFEKTHIE